MLKNIKKTVNLLKKKKFTLSVAESCTGGMLAQAITSVSGASKIFNFGIITYSNKSKNKHLKVPLKIIQKYGAVSKECCKSMVNNLSRLSSAKINIAITGIAGPNGGTISKPVGLVYIGIKKGSKITIQKNLFKNKNRILIQKATTNKAFKAILALK